jgi:hypothetical protein
MELLSRRALSLSIPGQQCGEERKPHFIPGQYFGRYMIIIIIIIIIQLEGKINAGTS